MPPSIIVIKVGTSSLIDTRTGRTHVSALARLAEAAMRLQRAGLHVIIVSSGAVGLGCARLGLTSRPATVAGKQAAAAVGQVRLMSLFEGMFSAGGGSCAQVLLTYDAIGDRTQYLNARNTFAELLRLGVVPIVNENDTVATHEIRVGDNDTLSALVAAMVGGQWLLLLTDVEALFEANPRSVPEARPLRVVSSQLAIQSLRRQMQAGAPRLGGAGVELGGEGGSAGARGCGGALEELRDAARGHAEHLATPTTGAHSPPSEGGGAGSQWGTGGMLTKLKAAQLATAAGVSVLITCTANLERLEALLSRGAEEEARAGAARAGSPPASPGRAPPSGFAAGEGSAPTPAPAPHASLSLFSSEALGTTFLRVARPATGRKRWILSLAPHGSLRLDAGAVAAVVDARKSLFPAGVAAVEGEWEAQDAVLLCAPDGTEVARALINYSAADCRRLAGKQSAEIADVLGFGTAQLADRDNIVVLQVGKEVGAP